MRYCYARLSPVDLGWFRLFGPGLGNLLFPWARSVVLARQLGLRQIAPTWPQFKPGPLLRGERDARHYQGLFTPDPQAFTGLPKLRCLLSARRIPEAQARHARDGELVECTGMASLFEPIAAHHGEVREALLRITRAPHLSGLQHDFRGSVSLHVRLGDFSTPANAQALQSAPVNTRLPLAWYVDILRDLRARHGQHLRAHVFSDGSDEELAPLLQEHNCGRIGFGSALADLWAMSHADILVASGSTFSMWASFLGRMPVIWYPGQLRQKLYGSSGTLEAELLRYP